MNKPDIYLLLVYEEGVQPVQLQEICAGLEEEGVPFRLLQAMAQTPDDGGHGAMAAAQSPLQVAIVVDQHGKVRIHHEKLAQNNPYLTDTLANGRRAGKNAARLIKGLPLNTD